MNLTLSLRLRRSGEPRRVFETYFVRSTRRRATSLSLPARPYNPNPNPRFGGSSSSVRCRPIRECLLARTAHLLLFARLPAIFRRGLVMPVLSEFAAAMLGVDASGVRVCAKADVVHKTKSKVANKRMGPHRLALVNSPSMHAFLAGVRHQALPGARLSLKCLVRGFFRREPRCSSAPDAYVANRQHPGRRTLRPPTIV